MPALTEAHQEALRHAREAASVVLAKHPNVTGSGIRSETGLGPVDLGLGCDRILAAYERQDVGRGEHATGVCGP